MSGERLWDAFTKTAWPELVAHHATDRELGVNSIGIMGIVTQRPYSLLHSATSPKTDI